MKFFMYCVTVHLYCVTVQLYCVTVQMYCVTVQLYSQRMQLCWRPEPLWIKGFNFLIEYFINQLIWKERIRFKGNQKLTKN